MVFFMEAAALCLFFHLMIWLVLSKKQAAFVNDYPPIVTNKLRELGLIAKTPPARKKDILRKLLAVLIYSVLFALLL